MAVARSARLDRTARDMRVEACEQGERLQGCAPSSADDEHQQGRARAQRRSDAGSPLSTVRHSWANQKKKSAPKYASSFTTVSRLFPGTIVNVLHRLAVPSPAPPSATPGRTQVPSTRSLTITHLHTLTHTHSLSRDTHETDTRTSQSNLKTNPTHRPTQTHTAHHSPDQAPGSSAVVVTVMATRRPADVGAARARARRHLGDGIPPRTGRRGGKRLRHPRAADRAHGSCPAARRSMKNQCHGMISRHAPLAKQKTEGLGED